MLRNKMSGFTLIELMVVIVIIGVLASLAIPRFSEASDKAKIAEAPRILASFESAYLAGKAELGDSIKNMGDIIFDTLSLKSKWFGYTEVKAAPLLVGFSAKASGKIGKVDATSNFWTEDSLGASGYTGIFAHCFDKGQGTTDYAVGKKYVPSFLSGTAVSGGCKNK